VCLVLISVSFVHPLFLRNQGSAFDFGELEEAFALPGIKIRNDEAKSCMFHCFSFLLMSIDVRVISNSPKAHIPFDIPK